MNTHRCCEVAASDSRSEPFAAPTKDGVSHRLKFAQRCLNIAGWIVPGAILALVPKCPACLAGYLAVGTSFGLSLSTAAHLRASLLILCIASLLYLVVRRLGRFIVVRSLFQERRVIVPRSKQRRLHYANNQHSTNGTDRYGVYDWPVGQMMKMSEMGMEQCLDKMAASCAKAKAKPK